MGKRGPRPNVSTVKRSRKDNPSRKAPPALDPSVPACPDWMPEGAVLIFNDLAAELTRRGTLTACEPLLPMLAMALHRWRQAEEAIGDELVVVEARSTYEIRKPNPTVAIAQSYAASAFKLSAEFGLTPRSRGDVQPLAGGETDALRDLLFGPKKNNDPVPPS